MAGSGFEHYHLVQQLCLRQCAREAIQDETVAAVLLSNAIGDYTDDEFITYEPTAVHESLRLFANGRASLNSSSQHVTYKCMRSRVSLVHLHESK